MTYGQRGVRGMFNAAMVSQYLEKATGSFFYDPPALPSFDDFAKGLSAIGQALEPAADQIMNWGNNLLADMMDWMQNDDTPGQAFFSVPPEALPFLVSALGAAEDGIVNGVGHHWIPREVYDYLFKKKLIDKDALKYLEKTTEDSSLYIDLIHGMILHTNNSTWL